MVADDQTMQAFLKATDLEAKDKTEEELSQIEKLNLLFDPCMSRRRLDYVLIFCTQQIRAIQHSLNVTDHMLPYDGGCMAPARKRPYNCVLGSMYILVEIVPTKSF